MNKEKIAIVIAAVAICAALYSALKNLNFSKPQSQQVEATIDQNPPSAPGDTVTSVPPAAYPPSAPPADAGIGVSN